MATEKDFELLDDYIANRMDGAAKASFENKLKADPDLQHELNVQQSVIDGIRKARAIELKSMLQNIPVPATPQGGAISAGAKVAITTISAAILVTALYLYFNRETPVEQAATEQVTPSKPSDSSGEPETPDQESSSAENNTTSDSDVAEKTAPAGNESASATASEKPALEVFDPQAETEETVAVSDESPRTSTEKSSSVSVQIDRQHKQYSFHYQFRDEKLFLYGPFEKNLYEILEFIDEDKRTMFLFYKSRYYLLKEQGDEIKPLTAITDTALIGKLREYRRK